LKKNVGNMSSEEVLEVMKGNGWMTSRQIAQKINIGRRSLRRALCCMAWHNEIQRKKDETKRHAYLYKYGGCKT